MGSVRILTVVALVVGASLLSPVGSQAQGSRATFRVCADPNNLPYSNERLEGFKNKIVELIAREFGATPTFTWWPDRSEERRVGKECRCRGSRDDVKKRLRRTK